MSICEKLCDRIKMRLRQKAIIKVRFIHTSQKFETMTKLHKIQLKVTSRPGRMHGVAWFGCRRHSVSVVLKGTNPLIQSLRLSYTRI